jgi:hypothetical protein
MLAKLLITKLSVSGVRHLAVWLGDLYFLYLPRAGPNAEVDLARQLKSATTRSDPLYIMIVSGSYDKVVGGRLLFSQERR